MQTFTQRIPWLDNMKGIGILILITIAHTEQYSFILKIERSLLMPLFFFVSGFLFKHEKFNNIVDLFRKQVQHLLVPYLFFAIIAFLITSIKYIYKDGASFLNNYPDTIINPLWGIIRGNSTSLRGVKNGPLWFLTCLFCLQIVFYLITKYIKNIIPQIIVILMCIIAGYFCKLLPFNNNFFFSFNTSLVVMLFFALGYYSRSKLLPFINSLKPWIIIITIPIQIYFVTLLDLPSLFAFNQYGNPYMTIIVCLISLLNIILISKVIPANSLTNYLGKSTLFIFGFHYPLLVIIIPFIVNVLNINSFFNNENPENFNILIHSKLLLISLIYGGIQLILVSLIIPILKKYFSKIFG